MSRNESWRTRHYWESIGGLLIEEFLAVRRDPTKGIGRRLIDGVIVKGEPTERRIGGTYNIQNKDVICIQTKSNRLGMYLMGQAYFSRILLENFRPRSIHAIAICARNDPIMETICQAHDIEVVVIPESDNPGT